jgi:hypothetical protein
MSCAERAHCVCADTKNSQGVGPGSISELALNAVSVKWNPREGPVRVSSIKKNLNVNALILVSSFCVRVQS